MYQNPSYIQQKARSSILITGSARSGTSIFGKLCGSLESAEYFFEPALLFSLFSILEELNEGQARLLFDTYAYEDLLVGALSGRTINLRKQDDSSIYHTKPHEEIAKRLEEPARKRNLGTSSATCVLKIPDFVYKVPLISRMLGLQRVLICIRDPYCTIHSLLAKRWFADSSLQAGDIMWPNRYSTEIPAPHWLPSQYLGEWESMSEVDRAALYYIIQTEIPAVMEYVSVVDYEQLIARPRDLINLISSRLDLAFGPTTETIINQVNIQKTSGTFDLKNVRHEFRERALSAYERASGLRACL